MFLCLVGKVPDDPVAEHNHNVSVCMFSYCNLIYIVNNDYFYFSFVCSVFVPLLLIWQIIVD